MLFYCTGFKRIPGVNNAVASFMTQKMTIDADDAQFVLALGAFGAANMWEAVFAEEGITVSKNRS